MDEGSLFGVLVPTALAVTLSPLPIAAVVMLLLSRHGRGPATAFAAGWVGGSIVGVIVLALAAEALPDPGADGSDPVSGWLTFGAGVLLLGIAVWQWVRRRLPDGRPASARWSGLFDGVGPRRAALFGFLSVVANPKNVVLSLAAGVAVGESTSGAGIVVLGVVVYVAVAAIAVVVPVAAVAVAPLATARPLAALREFLLRYGVVVLVVVLVALGVLEVVEGLGQL